MIRAIHFPDRGAFFKRALGGSLWFEPGDDGQADHLHFFCPCGCGDRARIPIGLGVKPLTRPSWRWNGSQTETTLSPSIRQLNCGWHGWLRNGYWRTER